MFLSLERSFSEKIFEKILEGVVPYCVAASYLYIPMHSTIEEAPVFSVDLPSGQGWHPKAPDVVENVPFGH